MTTPSEMLGATVLFAEVHPAHREQIAAAMERRAFRQGEEIVRAGTPGDAMYVVVSGRVSVVTRSDDLGLALELARLGPGDHFGEMALLTDEPRSATVAAIEDTVVLGLPRQVFERLVVQLPQVLLAVSRGLALRLSHLDRGQGVGFVSLSRHSWNADLWALVPPDVWRRWKIVPLTFERGVLTVAMTDPTNQVAIDEVSRCLPRAVVRPVAVSQTDFERFVARGERSQGTAGRASAVPMGGEVRVRSQDVAFLSPSDEREDRVAVATGIDAVALLSQMVAEALSIGTSDIHIESDRGGLAVRYRVEGTLHRSSIAAPRSALRPLVSRLKVLAGIDITESRLPQTGRIGMTVGDRDYDLRVATIPTRMGEKAALRILDSAAAIQPLTSLIVAEKAATALRKCLFRPWGAVVVTGPTGSGKTTTLYSALSERTAHGTQLNVMTAEDPVEYYLPGVTQVQINEAVGLTYPEALRAFLRQDPDILVIGETRDAGTARIALEAALTGHLVLTTMHTNDAFSTVVRLREMGMEPFLLASSLLCVVAQRLVRRLCPACRRPGTYMPAVLENLRGVGALREGEEPPLFEAVGCDRCGGSGYKGRIGVFEILLMDEEAREAVAQDVPLARIRTSLEGKGFVGLGRYANYLLKSGLTVPGEVLRAVRMEQTLGK